MEQREKRLLIIVGILLLIAGAVSFFIFHQSEKTKSTTPLLQVSFLDVGQGDSIFIEAPNGHQMLVDGGRDGEVLRQLSQVMPWYDRSIDVVVATHPDADHIGGLDNVLAQYKVSSVIRSDVLSDKQTEENFLQEADKEVGTTTIANRGMKIMLDQKDNVYFEVLSPYADARNWETNDASVVGKVVYGSTCFLLTGDAPKNIEDHLIDLENKDKQDELHCQVLKAGHHGSRTSTSKEFLEAVNPQYAIISAGKDNKYGHPHKEVIDLLNKYHVQILETFMQGTITFTSDGQHVFVK